MIIYYFYFLWSIDCWSPLLSFRLRILYLLSQYHDFLLYLSLCVTRPSSIFYHKNISGVRKLSSLWHVQYCQAYIKFMSRQNWLKKDINDKTLKDSLIVPDFLLFLFLWGLTFLLWYFSYYEAIIRVVVSFYLKWVQVLGFNFFKHTLFQSFFFNFWCVSPSLAKWTLRQTPMKVPLKISSFSWWTWKVGICVLVENWWNVFYSFKIQLYWDGSTFIPIW